MHGFHLAKHLEHSLNTSKHEHEHDIASSTPINSGPVQIKNAETISLPNFEFDFSKLSWILTPIKKASNHELHDTSDFVLNKRFRKYRSYPLDNFTSDIKIRFEGKVRTNKHINIETQ